MQVSASLCLTVCQHCCKPRGDLFPSFSASGTTGVHTAADDLGGKNRCVEGRSIE